MILDISVVLVLVLFCVRSFRGGFQGELLGAVGWIATILLATSFSGALGALLRSKVPQIASISTAAAFLGLIVIFRLVIAWIAKLIPEQSKGFSGALLQLLSVAGGFFKGAFFISVFLLLITSSSLQPKLFGQINESRLYDPMTDFSKIVVRITTEHVPNLKSFLDASSEKSKASSQ